MSDNPISIRLYDQLKREPVNALLHTGLTEDQIRAAQSDWEPVRKHAIEQLHNQYTEPREDQVLWGLMRGVIDRATPCAGRHALAIWMVVESARMPGVLSFNGDIQVCRRLGIGSVYTGGYGYERSCRTD